MFAPFHSQLFQFSSKERRLIYQRISPTGGNAKEIAQQAADILADEKRSNLWNGAFEVLKRSEITPQERAAIVSNLRERAKDMWQVHRDRLSIIITSVSENRKEVPTGSPEQPVTSDPKVKEGLEPDIQGAKTEKAAETKPGVADEAADKGKEKEGVVETALVYAEKVTETVLPNKWTDSMTQKNKRIFGTALTVGGVLIAAWLFNAFRKGKSAAEKSDGGFFNKLLIGGLAVGGALLGYKMFEEKIDKLIVDAKKKVGEMVDGARKKVDEFVGGAAKKGKDIAGEVAEKGKVIAGRATGKAEEASTETGQEVDDVPSQISGTSGEQSTEEKVSPSDVSEVAKTGAEVGAESMVARLLLFEDHPDIKWPEGEKAKDHIPKIVGVVNAFMPHKMNEIFECIQFGAMKWDKAEAIYTPPPQTKKGSPDYQAYRASTELLVRMCVRHKQDMEKLYGADVSDMNFSDYVRSLHKRAESLVVVREQIEKYGLDGLRNPMKWDFEKIIASLDVDPSINDALFAAIEGDDLVRKYPEDIVRKKIESLSLSDIFTMLQSLNINPEMTFADVRKCMEQQRESLENEERPPLEHVIALALISGVEKKMPSAEKLQVFFHGVFPTESWEEAGEGEAISDHNKKTIEGYIENMPFHRVLRLFAYNHMIEKENPTGVLLMQMEILRFIRDRETGDLGDGMLKTRAYQAADNFAESILDRSYFESLRKYLHVSDKMLAQTGKVFDDAGQMLLILAGRGIIAAGEPTLAFAKEHKVLTGAFGAYLLRKPVVLMANYRMSRYVPEMLAERVLGWNRGESSVRNNILAWLKIRHSPRVYNDAAGLLREVTGKIRNIRGVTSVPKPQVTALCDDMYDGFKRTIRDGATDVHYERFLARVRHERSLTTNADMIKALDKLDDEVTRLLAEGNVEARHAIRVTSHPFRGRIVSVGVPGLIEGLGIYWSLKSDIPLWWHYAQAEDEARGEEKDATADVLEWQKKKKEYVDIPMDLGSGIAFWLAQNRLKQMAVTRAGGIPFRGALGATRAGLGGATVAFLAIEALRMEAQYILDSVEKDVSLLELNDKDLEKMSKEELEETLLSRSSDRLSAGQKLRGLSLSRWIRGDTFEGMHWENEVLRENVMYGYLFDRLLRKGQMGDPFAMSLAVQIFDRDGSKKKDGAAAMRAYENDCQTYLHRRYGTRNDIKAISQQAGLERALHDADLYASFQADIRSCRRTFTRVEEISELTSNSLDAIASLEDRIALAGSDEVRNLTDQRDAKLAYIDDLNDEFILQMSILDGYEQIQLKQPDGSVVSLLDFATQPNENYEGSYADISEGDVIAQLTSYRAAKSAVMMESVEPKEDYQLFLKDAESLYEKLKVVNVPGGTWSINPEHYNLLLEYGFLLDMHPSFDSDLKVRQAIWDLPGIYWKQYPGEHPYAESFNNVRDLISENIAYVKALRHGEQYYPAKHENDPIHQTPFNVHYESSLGVSDPTIIVTLEGKEYVLEAKKKTEQSFDTSVGTFTYRPNASAGVHGEKGLWFFDGTQEGLFHVATRNNLGIEQPGEWMSVKERLRKNMIVKSGEWFPYLHDYFTLKAQVFEKGTIVEVQGTSLNHTKIKPYVELSWKGSKWEIRAIPGKHVRRLIFESMTSKEPETLVVEVNDQNEQMPLAA